MTRYRVIAPVVLAKTMTPEGVRWIHVQNGGTVPEDVTQEWIDGHLGVQMIAPIDAPEPKPAPPPARPEPSPPEPPAPPMRGRTPAKE